MRIGIGNTVPERSNLPGQSGGIVIPDEFIFEVNAAIGDTIDLDTRNGSNGVADFIINWGEGSDETVNATTASHTYTSSGTKVIKINKAGTNTPVDNFKVLTTNEGKSMVTKISNWGTTPWRYLSSSFTDCINLTTIEPAAFKGSTSGVDLNLAFKGCTSLTSLDLTSWNLTYGCSILSIVEDCSNLALVNKPSQPVKLTGSSSSAFKNVGNSLTDGCTFNLQGLDLSTSTVCSLFTLFQNSRINPSSSFANWAFNSSINSTVYNMFLLCEVTGTNSTLDISGWTTLNSDNFQLFAGAINNQTPSATGLTVNLSNLNVSNSTSFSQFFGNGLSTLYKSKVERIIGLNTWPDMVTNSQNLRAMFSGLEYCKLDSDQLSSSFRSSLTPSTAQEMFYGLSRFRAVGDKSLAPVLDNIDLSSSTDANMVYRMFEKVQLSSAFSFDNVTFPTTQPINISRLLFDLNVESNDLEIDLSSRTMKINSANGVGYNLRGATKFYLGNNIDFSSCTTMASFMFNAGGSSSLLDVKLPTNADYGNVTSWSNAFVSFDGIGPGGGLSTCVADTLIRRLYETSLNSNQQTLNIGSSRTTGSPSVVSSNITDLVAAGWSILDSSTDAVMPFEYTTPININTSATPTGSFTGGVFSSSNSNIAVDATTGEINTPNSGSTTIRYTLADGCYNEQAINVVGQLNNVYSMAFDGASTKINLPSTQISTGDISISFWLKSSDLSSTYNNIIGSNGTNNYNNIFTYLSLSDGKIATAAPSGTFPNSNFLTDVVADGNWNHICLSYVKLAGPLNPQTGVIKSYVNGELQYSLDLPSNLIWSNNTITTIGDYSQAGLSPVRAFLGSLDEIGIWNTALTEAEVQSIYNATETGKTADLNSLTTPPIAWYRMGD